MTNTEEKVMVSRNFQTILNQFYEEDPNHRMITELTNTHALMEADLKANTPHERIKMTQNIVDYAYKKHSPQDQTCTKGCAHCCKMLVCITEPEAENLATRIEFLAKNGLVNFALAITRKLKDQKDYPTDPEAWHAYTNKERACPYLDVDRHICTVYTTRPLACKTYYVKTDPSLCKMGKGPATVQVIANPMTELALSALYATTAHGNMAPMVLKALQRKQFINKIQTPNKGT